VVVGGVGEEDHLRLRLHHVDRSLDRHNHRDGMSLLINHGQCRRRVQNTRQRENSQCVGL
jgi:hypothetical protein